MSTMILPRNNRSVLSSKDTFEEAKRKFKGAKLKFALNNEQINELMNISYVNSQYHLMIRIALHSGCRVGELTHLRIEQINFEQELIMLSAYEDDDYCEEWNPKTKAGNRIIPIDHEDLRDLKKEINKRKRGYVFLSQKSGQNFRVDSVIRQINIYARKCESIGHTIGMHCLRRTFASKLAASGIYIAKLSKILGHKDVKTTFLYLYEITETNFDDVREVVKSMGVQ